MSRPPKTGIVDPWTVTEPFVQPATPAALGKPLDEPKRRINMADIDFDADLRMPEQYFFRAETGTIEVKNKRIKSGNDALRDLVQCLFQVLEEDDGPDQFEAANISFMLHTREWFTPAPDVPVTRIRTIDGYVPKAVIWFVRQNFDRGMLRLIQLLNAVQRRPGDAGINILKRWGVTPMMRMR